ncbi:hypothetical protein C900_02396 [Fulvivirga imtechensis AK7]|uniref:Uncharacterized protein n=1 Tax=Fulvivirga imtechensis AK7 TaxID=1237149 RepID=L8JS18_9BACT|nr:hypothetical protein C900_02396 [Fulvivirga imtechensis AK7]
MPSNQITTQSFCTSSAPDLYIHTSTFATEAQRPNSNSRADL